MQKEGQGIYLLKARWKAFFARSTKRYAIYSKVGKAMTGGSNRAIK